MTFIGPSISHTEVHCCGKEQHHRWDLPDDDRVCGLTISIRTPEHEAHLKREAIKIRNTTGGYEIWQRYQGVDWQRIEDTSWHQLSMLVCFRTGADVLGITSAVLQKHDRIIVPFACDVPLIIRPKADSGGEFTLVEPAILCLDSASDIANDIAASLAIV